MYIYTVTQSVYIYSNSVYIYIYIQYIYTVYIYIYMWYIYIYSIYIHIQGEEISGGWRVRVFLRQCYPGLGKNVDSTDLVKNTCGKPRNFQAFLNVISKHRTCVSRNSHGERKNI